MPLKRNKTIELTRRIRAGNREAEAEFVETYSNSLLLLLLKKTQNPDIAKDCCQQALLITLIKIRSGDILKPESLLSFLRHTAINVAITHFRQERRYIPLSDEAFSASTGTGNDAELDKDSETVRLMINKVLKLLTVERDREVLRRFYLQEEEKNIIRRDLEISSAHFDRVLYRAKCRMRHLLDYHEDMRTFFLQSFGHRLKTSPKRPLSRRLRSTNTDTLKLAKAENGHKTRLKNTLAKTFVSH